MLKVGLTGGMACGKSVVGEMFARLGAHVIQADGIAHALMRPGEAVYEQIVARFGREILAGDGSIDRVKLANAVFVSSGANTGPAARDGGATRGAEATSPRIEELNAIVHPAVIRRQDEWMNDIGRRDPTAVTVVEAALIYEAGGESHFDKIVVVVCDVAQKVERFARRVKLPLEAARAELERRMLAQMPEEEKARRADYRVFNTGSLNETEEQVRQIFAELKREALARAGRQN